MARKKLALLLIIVLVVLAAGVWAINLVFAMMFRPQYLPVEFIYGAAPDNQGGEEPGQAAGGRGGGPQAPEQAGEGIPAREGGTATRAGSMPQEGSLTAGSGTAVDNVAADGGNSGAGAPPDTAKDGEKAPGSTDEGSAAGDGGQENPPGQVAIPEMLTERQIEDLQKKVSIADKAKAVSIVLGSLSPSEIAMISGMARGGITPGEKAKIYDILRKKLNQEQKKQVKNLSYQYIQELE